MARRVETGIDWEAVRSELDSMEWEDDPDNRGSQERRCFLGTVFALMPSGKYYTPYASSNVDACPVCEGTGQTRIRQSNREKGKAAARIRHRNRKMVRLRSGAIPSVFHAFISDRRELNVTMHRKASGVMSCPRCMGMGSAEARDDETYQEALEQEASDRGLFITSNDGDPCDIFAGECRDTPDDEDEDSEPEGFDMSGLANPAGWDSID